MIATKKMYLYFFVLLILAQIIPPYILAQQPYVFRHLSTTEGLSNSNVKAILRDGTGFLWIGTSSGLNRYDGYKFKQYTIPINIPNLSYIDDICSLQEDGEGNLWVSDGITYAVYCREKDCFTKEVPALLQSYGLNINGKYQIYVDKDRNLWILNNDIVYYYNCEKKRYNKISIDPSIIEQCVDITDNANYLYLMHDTGQIWQLNKSSQKLSILELPASVKRSNRIYADFQEGLWLFSDMTDEIYYQKLSEGPWAKIVLNSVLKTQSYGIKSILDDKNGNIWFGTDHKGAFIYNKDSNRLINILYDYWDSSSIASNNIPCMYQDDNGCIWLGHNKKGLSFYHESFQQFVNFQHSESGSINAILEDRYGNLWLGTDGNGIYLKKDITSRNIHKVPFPNLSIISLLEDCKGRIWISAYQNGIFCYEKGELRHFTQENSDLYCNTVWDMQEDCYGNLWLASLEATQYFNPSTKTFSTLQLANGNQIQSMDIFYNGKNTMYLATDYGLCAVDIPNRSVTVHLENKQGTQQFKQTLISNVYQDKNGLLWLGHFQGITVWDLQTDSLYYWDKNNGLCDNIVQAIAEDDYGNIWITTSKGISLLSVWRDSNGYLSHSVRSYSTKDGMRSDYFSAHAICRLKNGNLVLGGESYVLADPKKMRKKSNPPSKIVFTDLSIGNQPIQVDSLYDGRILLNKSIEQTSTITFNASDRIITLEFSIRDLLNASNVTYAYLLKGFQREWMFTQDNKIVFSSLPPGNYQLLIKASNSDGLWNEDAVALCIVILPPFYMSKWAYILYGILGCVLITCIVFYNKKQHLRKMERQRLRLENEQKVRVNDFKLNFFANISHDLRTPLTLIITPLQLLINETHDVLIQKRLLLIYKNAQHLLSLVNSLLDFRKLDIGAEVLHCKSGDIVAYIKEICTTFYDYAEEHQILFSFECSIENLLMSFDPDKICKIINNLLSNAFKFTPNGGSITVRIHTVANKVCISVVDTGKGIKDVSKKNIFNRFYQEEQNEKVKGNGIGLHIVQEYVRLHEGEVTVEDNHPYGSIFSVWLPIDLNDQLDISMEKQQEMDISDEVSNIVVSDLPILLLVDDNKDFCTFLADSLKNGYTVLTAESGEEALHILYNNEVHLIISDVMMPKMSGTELCRRVKTDINLSHIPIILLTARVAEEYVLEGLELGADDYLTKPFNLALLHLRIKKIMEWTEHCHKEFKDKIDISPSEITITSLDEQLISRAIKIVEEHISNVDFSVENLSEELGVSRSYLYKKLMFITGKGPAEFIRILRLKRAKQLLGKSKLQIAEIAYAVGFNSPKRFTINFKNEFGVSPSEYIKGLK